MSIQKEFVLRYHTEGHIRFQVPARICHINAAKVVTEGISAIDGVYRVNFYRGQQKLSIRFNESRCDFKTLSNQLFVLLTDLENDGLLLAKSLSTKEDSGPWKEKARAKFGSLKVTRWVKGKVGDVKETLHAAKIITKLGTKKPKAFIKDPEKAIIDFLNDILVLYLIKIHWTNITQNWLVRPFKHRYEWMAVFYMVFLLVRSRRPK